MQTLVAQAHNLQQAAQQLEVEAHAVAVGAVPQNVVLNSGDQVISALAYAFGSSQKLGVLRQKPRPLFFGSTLRGSPSVPKLETRSMPGFSSVARLFFRSAL